MISTRPLSNRRLRRTMVPTTSSLWQGKGLPRPAKIPGMPGKIRIGPNLTSFPQEPETYEGLRVTQRPAANHSKQAERPCQLLAASHVRHWSGDCSPAVYVNASSDITPHCRTHRGVAATDVTPNDTHSRFTLSISVHAGCHHSLLRSTVAAVSP